MPMFDNTRRQLNDLMGQRANFLAAAEAAQNAGNPTEFQAQMANATALNPQIDDLKAIVDEADRYASVHAPSFGSGRQDLEEMGRILADGKPVKLDLSSLVRSNSTTLATGTIAEPTGVGRDLNAGFSGVVSGLIDLVRTEDLTGMGSYKEAYVVSEMEAQGGKVTTKAGTARTDSDPTLAVAEVKPYEGTVTTYVDRNVSRLSPVPYAQKIQAMAYNALRRKINGWIVNGDGQNTPDMFGILNAKNSDGTAIYNDLGTLDVDADFLDSLVFGYGSDEAIGQNARLLLTKPALKRIGKIRGSSDMNRVFKITPEAGNPNAGVIDDSGLIVPYTIISGIGNTKVAYGDPMNYLLGLFGEYSIRVSDDYKFGERLLTIAGDVFVGGNLVAHHGFVTATLAAAATTTTT